MERGCDEGSKIDAMSGLRLMLSVPLAAMSIVVVFVDCPCYVVTCCVMISFTL